MRKALVSSSGSRVMLDAFASLGLPSDAIRREAGLNERELEDPDRMLPATGLYRMWEVADRMWGRPALGLSAAGRVPIGAYEVLDYLVLSADTLEHALTNFACYYAVATRTTVYRIHREGGEVACEMAWNIPAHGVMFHLRDYSLALVAARAKEASGGVPLRVELEGPPLTTAEHYGRVFGAPAVLSAPRSALVFSLEAWNAPVARRDAFLHQTLRRHAELLLERASPATHQDDIAERVRAELLQRVRLGTPSIDEVARALGMGPRTLQRALRVEGVSFVRLCDEVRASLAREYLGDRGLNVGEVAYMLGFSEVSAFSRAFRRWTGHSPRRFREDTRRAGLPPSRVQGRPRRSLGGGG